MRNSVRTYLLCALACCVSIPGLAQARPAGKGGAHVDAPFKGEIYGAQCYSGKGKNAGDVAFGFPARGMQQQLAFTIGPLRDGLSPGQENNKPYSGPGSYTNVGITLKSNAGKMILGYGTITVNADEKTGTFKIPGKASGIWDCGEKLSR